MKYSSKHYHLIRIRYLVSDSKSSQCYVGVCIFAHSEDHRTVIRVEGVVEKLKFTSEWNGIFSIDSNVVFTAFVNTSWKERGKVSGIFTFSLPSFELSMLSGNASPIRLIVILTS